MFYAAVDIVLGGDQAPGWSRWLRLFEACTNRVERAAPGLAFADATGARPLQRVLVTVTLFEDSVSFVLDSMQCFRDQIDCNSVRDEGDRAARGTADASNQAGCNMRERIEVKRLRQFRALVVLIL
jgi:hypothetical protein